MDLRSIRLAVPAATQVRASQRMPSSCNVYATYSKRLSHARSIECEGDGRLYLILAPQIAERRNHSIVVSGRKIERAVVMKLIDRCCDLQTSQTAFERQGREQRKPT